MDKTARHYLLAAAFLAVLLRLVWIWVPPFWYDENYTLLVTRLPLAAMFQAVAGDVHPPLYYLLLWPLSHVVGSQVWLLRMFSALCSIAALPVAWTLFARLGSDRVRTAAWLFVAFNPILVYYAGEARMYSLFVLLVLLAVWASRRPGWLYFLAVSAVLYTHNYGVFYAACIAMAALLQDRTQFGKLVLYTGLAGLAFVPWLFVLRAQMTTIGGNYWIDTVSALTPASLLYTFTAGWMTVGYTRQALFILPLALGWLVFSLAWTLRRKRIDAAYLVLAFGPFLCALLASLVWGHSVMLFRALAPAVPFLGVVLCRPVETMPRRGLYLAAALLGPLLLVNTLRFLWPDYELKSISACEMTAAIETIRAELQPGDIVLHAGEGSWVDFVPYLPDAPQYVLLPDSPVTGGLSPRTLQALGVPVVDEVPPYTRAWVLTVDTAFSLEVPELTELTADLEPVFCLRDDPTARQCLYLVESDQ